MNKARKSSALAVPKLINNNNDHNIFVLCCCCVLRQKERTNNKTPTKLLAAASSLLTIRDISGALKDTNQVLQSISTQQDEQYAIIDQLLQTKNDIIDTIYTLNKLLLEIKHTKIVMGSFVLAPRFLQGQMTSDVAIVLSIEANKNEFASSEDAHFIDSPLLSSTSSHKNKAFPLPSRRYHTLSKLTIETSD